MRYLLIACLLAGCSAGAPSINDPSKTAKQYVIERSRATLVSEGMQSAAIDCVMREVERRMTEADYRVSDAAMRTSSPDPQGSAIVNASFASCR